MNSTPTGSKNLFGVGSAYRNRTLCGEVVENKVHILSYILCFVSFQYLLWVWRYKHGGIMRVGGSVKTQLSYDRDLLVWRWLHVSAVLGHLQVISSFTNNNNKEKMFTLDKVLLRGTVYTVLLSKTSSNVYVFSLLLLIVKELMTWRWPSTAETCSHRQTNKSRSYDSCVLTDPPTLICIKTQRG